MRGAPIESGIKEEAPMEGQEGIPETKANSSLDPLNY